MYSDTIAAIATAMTNSGIGIVRISGQQSFQVIDKIYRGKKNQLVSAMESHTIHYGFICDGQETIDEVIVLLMRGPRSYTGEDTVEIDCHGGSYVVKKIFETVIKYGARPAEPGEFTKRAFLNGRIDLSQAEAVGDIISAQNEYALKNSVSQLKGSIKIKINDIRNKIIYETAFIESALDDPEHIDIAGYPVKLYEKVQSLLSQMEELIATADNARIMKEGINTVIVGKPNAGKSSLLNIMVGEERAIVTEIAGTTRDILQEHVLLDGLMLNIIDTAGIHNTQDIVEKIGVDKAKKYAGQADLIIYVVDGTRALDESDHEIIKMIEGMNVIVLLNKSDLARKIDKKEINKYLNKPIIDISAKEETGIKEFKKMITDMFFQGNISFNDEIYITNIRQKTSLIDARNSLFKVCESIKNGMPEDFYSIDLMDAYESLGLITGDTIGEDLADEIFSKFCMGK